MNERRIPWYISILSATLLILLFVLCIFFVREYRHAQQVREINSYRTVVNTIRRTHPLTLFEVGVIEPWMTFRYINTLFNLPQDYLRTTLSISEKKYPNIAIGKYARNKKINAVIFERSVKARVEEYLRSSIQLSQ